MALGLGQDWLAWLSLEKRHNPQPKRLASTGVNFAVRATIATCITANDSVVRMYKESRWVGEGYGQSGCWRRVGLLSPVIQTPNLVALAQETV